MPNFEMLYRLLGTKGDKVIKLELSQVGTKIDYRLFRYKLQSMYVTFYEYNPRMIPVYYVQVVLINVDNVARPLEYEHHSHCLISFLLVNII